MSNQLSSFTTAQLRRAADLQDKIETLNKELAAILGVSASASTKAPLKKGGISAAGRAKIAAAAKARWAKVKAAKPASKPVTTPAAKAPAKKGGMSAAAKAKLSAIAKARWAKIKAGGKKTL
jgi:hypothetical protein